jgi:hypothetical protein
VCLVTTQCFHFVSSRSAVAVGSGKIVDARYAESDRWLLVLIGL